MRFSVVIPVYNVAEYLQGCIDSVLANDCSDCEIILVDDGSTDGVSSRICDENAARYPELIRVIHQENRGLGGARNTGLEAACGEYLFFLDSDDTIEPESLSVLSAAIESTHADIVAFNLSLDDGEGSLLPCKANYFHVDRPFSLTQKAEFLLSMPNACGRIWKRELFLESGVRYPSRVWYEDIRTTTKLFALAESIFTIDDCLYRYLQRPGSIMNSGKLDRNGEILEAFDDILIWFKERGLLETYREELTRLAVDHVLLAATVRVARADPKHYLLRNIADYMEKNFPGYRKNPYVAQLPKLHKLLLVLIGGGHYRMIQFLFRLKDGAK